MYLFPLNHEDEHMRYLLKFLSCWLLAYDSYSASNPYKNLVFTFSGGPGWSSPFQANIVSTNENPYHQVQFFYPNIQTMGIGEFFISSANPFYKNIYGQFGGAISGAGAASSDVNLDFYDEFSQYNYHLTQYRVAFRGKLFTKSFDYNPYVTSSVGAGFTSLKPENNLNYGYQISIIDDTAYSLNYTFGVGIQHTLNQRWSFSIGYEYYNWGKADTNLVPNVHKKTINIQLPTMNVLLLSLSYQTAD